LYTSQRAAGKFLFESSRGVGKAQKDDEETTPMDVEEKESLDSGDETTNNTPGIKKPVEIENKEIYGDASKYYKELYNIFGESLEPYLVPSTTTEKSSPSISNSFL